MDSILPTGFTRTSHMHRIRVWDLPTRLFHWALVACVIGLVVTANLGGNWMNWHLRLGYTVLTLLLFRLAWGFLGGHWSRFSTFLYPPRSVLAHLRGKVDPLHRVGHNPLGALSVFAMLLVLLLQAGSGLMSDDEIAFFGPLVPLVSHEMVALATSYHKGVGKPLLIALVALHVAALLYHRLVRREALVGAMVSGDKSLDHTAPSARDGWRQHLVALVVLGLCAGLVSWLVGLGAGF
jgi:cytochrome b